jgi:Peptidase_C39 like family
MKKAVIIALPLVMAMVIAAAVLVPWFWKREVEPRGGCYFFRRVELSVPHFFQNDDRWGNDPLGATDGTLSAEGCAVTAAAMVLSYYGVDTDPKRLNEFLTKNGGYTDRGWIFWEKAAELAPNRVRHVYEDLPSYYLIDKNLVRNNPVIVRLRYPNGVTHFVVVVGKHGFDYLIRDPGSGGRRGVYPLRDFGSDVEALRFYEVLRG